MRLSTVYSYTDVWGIIQDIFFIFHEKLEKVAKK